MSETFNISTQEAEDAVKILLKFIGEDPTREGLVGTPARVIRSFSELFVGYSIDTDKIISTTFKEVANYSNMVLVKDIAFSSYCEHHMLPIIGKVHVAYLPDSKVVGLSKIVRIVQAYSKRLQIQERLTEEIAATIMSKLNPKGVAVVIDAEHYCMKLRGVNIGDVTMRTASMYGVFLKDEWKKNFMDAIK